MGTAIGAGVGAGAAIAADELKSCAFGAPYKIANPKTASTAVKVTTVLFMIPPKFEVCTTALAVRTILTRWDYTDKSKRVCPNEIEFIIHFKILCPLLHESHPFKP
jgi:hypothetical protein